MKSITLNSELPNDPSGTALGVAFRDEDIQDLLRPGLQAIQTILPTLAEKAREILAELDDPNNPMAQTSMRVVKIDRTVSEKHLRRGEVKVLDCDKTKIFALFAGLHSSGSSKSITLAETILTSFAQGGIPIQVEGEPRIGGSIFFKIFDESLELKLIRPT